MALSGSLLWTHKNLYCIYLTFPLTSVFFKSLCLFHNYLYNCTSYNHVKTRLKCSRSYNSHGIMRQMIILNTFQFLWTRSMENRRNSDQPEKGLTCVQKTPAQELFTIIFLSVQKLDLCHIDQKMTLCFICSAVTNRIAWLLLTPWDHCSLHRPCKTHRWWILDCASYRCLDKTRVVLLSHKVFYYINFFFHSANWSML